MLFDCLELLGEHMIQQMVHGFDVALGAMAADGKAAGGTQVADLAKVFALADIGNVDFYCWYCYRFESVQQSHGSMGVSSWVDDNAVRRAIGRLDRIDDRALVVGLDVHLDAALGGMGLNQLTEIAVCGAAIDVWFADAQHIKIWAVNNA